MSVYLITSKKGEVLEVVSFAGMYAGDEAIKHARLREGIAWCLVGGQDVRFRVSL